MLRFAHGDRPVKGDIDRLVIAGWTGRNDSAVRHHIRELQALGVAPPSAVPLYYRVGAALLTQAPEIEVLGTDSSGEVEPVLLRLGGTDWLGLGSDHTDRRLETVSVAASKQACPKPLARGLWPLTEVADRLDTVELRCHARIDGRWTLYQNGRLDQIRPLAELAAGAEMAEGTALFCGTLPAHGGVRPATAYRMELHDPQGHAALELTYAVRCLPQIQ